ncbi:hypothetical protein UlMin_000482 [Ulmus minor]
MANQQQNSNDQNTSQVLVVMVAFPAQSHLNQSLHLSRLISAYNIPVYYFNTATHNRQATLRIHGWNPTSNENIKFHDLVNPSPFSSPDPQLRDIFYSSDYLTSFLNQLSSKARRLIVIYDSAMTPVVHGVSPISNAEFYSFSTGSAYVILLFIWEQMGKPSLGIDVNMIAPEELPPAEESFDKAFIDYFGPIVELLEKVKSGNLFNTTRVMEGVYMDILDKISPDKKNYAIGPLNPLTFLEQKASNGRHMCLEWLDKQAPNSVVYVSFGTTGTMSDEQIKELALGLKQSQHKFIWVLRDADKIDVFAEDQGRKLELPEGYEESVKSQGIVVRDWAPQLEILAHSSTGGFLSHCGWGSVMESISMGVPMGIWPMIYDQPRVAVLVTKFLKVGIVVREWKHRNEVATSTVVATGIRKLMASKGGDEIRMRAAEMGGAVRRSMDDNGASRLDLDSFIGHITR